MPKPPIVFISFRTADSKQFAKDLQHFLQYPLNLEVRLGDDTLPGEEWEKQIPQHILESEIFIAVIGEKWARGNGTRDINDEEDVVRREVELGLTNVGRFGVVTLDDFKLKKEDLPPALKKLPDLQWATANSEFKKGDGIGKLTAKMRLICDELQPKPIVLLSSTLAFLGDKVTTDGLTYFVTLLVTLVHRIMGPDREVILKVPPYGKRDASKTASQFQRELLEEIVENYKRYSGIIIAPFETENLVEEIRKLWERDNRFPIATIDKTYDQNHEFFKRHGVLPPPGVACDGRHNGQLAAKCVIDYLRLAKIPEPNVVVLQGLEGSAPRILGFIERIKEHNAKAEVHKKIHVSVSKKMEFLSADASEKAGSYLRQGKEWDALNDEGYASMLKGQPAKRTHGVDVFFCCNDEMALGVCEKLELQLRKTNPVLHRTVVVGFDGIPEATRRIKNNDPWLLNSIDVKVQNQVNELVQRFIPAIKDHRRMENLPLEKGELLDADHQIDHVKSILDWRKKEEQRIKDEKKRVQPKAPRRGKNGAVGGQSLSIH